MKADSLTPRGPVVDLFKRDDGAMLRLEVVPDGRGAYLSLAPGFGDGLPVTRYLTPIECDELAVRLKAAAPQLAGPR